MRCTRAVDDDGGCPSSSSFPHAIARAVGGGGAMAIAIAGVDEGGGGGDFPLWAATMARMQGQGP